MRKKPIAVKKAALAPAMGAMKQNAAKLTQMASAGRDTQKENIIKGMGGPPPGFKPSKRNKGKK